MPISTYDPLDGAVNPVDPNTQRCHRRSRPAGSKSGPPERAWDKLAGGVVGNKTQAIIRIKRREKEKGKKKKEKKLVCNLNSAALL